MSIPSRVVSARRNFAGVCRYNRFQKIILVVFRFFEFSHSQGHLRPGPAGDKFGHVRYAAESGSIFGAFNDRCLSLKVRPLRNPDDRLAREGTGPRLLERSRAR
jgi:hypothetical protein